MCLRVLLGVSLSFQKQVLGRTFILAYGESSGFFYLWDAALSPESEFK